MAGCVPFSATANIWGVLISAVAFIYISVTFDPDKNARNIAERGLSFERVADLDWDTAVIVVDTRRDYGEQRLRVMTRLDGVLHAVVVTGSPDHRLPQGKQT